MNIAFIGCMVMNREISHEILHSENTCRAYWLRQNFHDTPELLKQELQRVVDEIEREQTHLPQGKRFDCICLGYGLCSDSVVGLRCRTIPLVIPKCEDCISLFLGSAERYRKLFDKFPGTYWYNPGWIEQGFTPSKESYERRYRDYVETYGEDNAAFLMEAEGGWKKTYNSCIYVDSPVCANDRHLAYAKEAAAYFGMEFRREQGDMTFFHKLLNGPWAEEEFLVCPAGSQVLRVYDDRKIAAGQPLKDRMRQQGMTVDFPCGGNHTCGKCKVRVSGAVEPASEEEKRFLTAAELEAGYRLACFCTVTGEVTILQEEAKTRILSWAKMPQIPLTEQGIGAACDIGTTTVVVRLYDRETGTLLAEAMEKNAQRAYGADVISRIADSNTGNLNALSNAIRNQLKDMLHECCERAGVKEPVQIVVTGNTTMLHLLEGLDPHSIAAAPYRAESLFGFISPRKLFGGEVYLPRCIGAFAGADLVCAILASGMMERNECALLVDVGTNGEMALLCDGKLICCSTAAGPAFEGAGLHMGMPAAEGAVHSIQSNGHSISHETIGGGEAVGICGSGIIDAVSVLKDSGRMDETGYLEEDFAIPGTGVVVTQEDVRQIQLAKAAVCAGIHTLLHEGGIDIQQVDRLYMAGGFGNYVNMRSAANIGLIPPELAEKAELLGNAAIAGASMVLLNERMRHKAEGIGAEAREINLSTNSFFSDKYVACMMFAQETSE